MANAQVLDQHLATHGPSQVRAFTATPSGEWLYLCEGATLVMIDTGDPNPATGTFSDVAFHAEDGSKRVPIGREGVVAAALLLDPAAQAVPTDGPNDLLYVAGGRQGLWMIEADTRVSNPGNRAWRIDDSGDLNPATQNSRRFCNALTTATIAGEEFLVALFGKSNASRLRLYRLSDLRAIPAAFPTDELGSVQAAYLEVQLKRHSSNLPSNSGSGAPYVGNSYAIGMSVHSTSTVPGQEEVDVYVAMTHHGVAKVRLFPNGSGAIDQKVTWGPVFGFATTASGWHPRYGDLELTFNSLDPKTPWYSGPPRVERRERPAFCDVAVVESIYGTHLYCAVDHLGVLRYDLSEPWAPGMPIDWHGGIDQVTNGVLVRDCILEDKPEDEPTGPNHYARRLSVTHDHAFGTFIAVTFNRTPLVKDLEEYRIEGTTYNHDLSWGGTRVELSGEARTLLYPAGLTGVWPHANVVDFGGSGLHVVEEQPDPSHVRVFHGVALGPATPMGMKELGICLAEVEVGSGATQGMAINHVRSQSHTAGRMAFHVGQSPSNPDVLVCGGNDADLPDDGWLYLDHGPSGLTIERHYTAQPGQSGQFDFPTGHRFDPESAWEIGSAGSTRTFATFNEGIQHTSTSPAWRWMWCEVEVPDTVAGAASAAPLVTHNWLLKPPPDRFQNIGRGYYNLGLRDPEFHAWLGTGTNGTLFGNRTRACDGLVAFNLEQFRDGIAPLAELDDTNDAPSSGLGNTIEYRSLVTHPEFNRMDAGDTTCRNWWKRSGLYPGANDDISPITTWTPEMIPVRASASSTTLDAWVVGVPCGFVYADPDWDIFDATASVGTPPNNVTGNPAWLPDPGTIWDSGFEHALWQFWPMGLEPLQGCYLPLTTGAGDGSTSAPTIPVPKGNSTLPKAMGQNSEGLAWEIEYLADDGDPGVAGDEVVWVFAVDFAGSIEVYRLEDILLQETPGLLNENLLSPVLTWDAPLGLYDDLPNNVFDLAIDDDFTDPEQNPLLYVAVRRVGIVVLEFDPGPTPSLTQLDIIQTGEHNTGVQVIRDSLGDKLLLASDYRGGIRVFGE